jgi:spectrin beta
MIFQLQVLVDDAARLQEAYPGGNAEQIAHHQSVVVENWGILQDKAAQRKEELQAALDLYRFLAIARDLIIWSNDIRTEMVSDETVTDVASVDALRKRHQELRAEIDSREDTFANVVATGQAMIEQGHFVGPDIQQKVDELMEERDKLHSTWDERQAYLEQLFGQQVFLRDANQLMNYSASQEAHLKSTDLGDNVDQVEKLIKRHEPFDTLLASQEPKLEALKDYGNQLMNERHFDGENIAQTLNEVSNRLVW